MIKSFPPIPTLIKKEREIGNKEDVQTGRHEYSNILPSQVVYHVAGGWCGSTKCRKRDVSNMPSKCVPAKQSRAA